MAATLDSLVAASDNSSITVNWTNNENYEHLYVIRNGSQIAEWTSSIPETYTDESVSTNTEYEYQIQAYYYVTGWTYSNKISITMFDDSGSETIELSESTDDEHIYGDTATETVELSEAISEVATISDTHTETVLVTDDMGDVASISLKVDYGYYLGDFSGKIYYEHEDYGSDDGTSISAYFLSKETDFADIDGQALDRYKTIYKVRLFYVDIFAGQSVTVSVSTDGGNTWINRSRYLGTGDGTVKSADFFFIKTSDVFQFKVAHDDTGKFQWINMEVFYTINGDYYELSA